jgi:hypothetical protein
MGQQEKLDNRLADLADVIAARDGNRTDGRSEERILLEKAPVMLETGPGGTEEDLLPEV